MGYPAAEAGLANMTHWITKKQQTHVFFKVLLGLIIGLVFVQYAVGFDVPTVVFLVLAAAIACFCSKNEVIAFFICCIPLHSMLSLTLTLALCLVICVIRLSGNLRLNLLAVCLVFLMMTWELLHYVGVSFSVVDFLVRFMPLIVLVLIISMDANRLDYGFIVRSFSVITVCVCMVLLGYLLIAADFDIGSVFSNLQRLGMTEQGPAAESVEIVNPNTLGIICVLASASLLQLAISGSGRQSDYILVAVLLIFGTMTLSRTFLVCLAVAAVLLLLSARRGVVERAKYAALLFAGILLVLLFLYLVFPELLNYFHGRFQEEDLTTGRVDAMLAYHEFIIAKSNIAFFGIGLQDLYEKLVLQYAVAAVVPHNGLQEIVIVWGIPGLLMLCMLLGLMVKQSRRYNRKQSLINYIPLLIILVKIQAGQMITSSYTILALSFAYLSLCYIFAPKQDSGNAEGSV